MSTSTAVSTVLEYEYLKIGTRVRVLFRVLHYWKPFSHLKD